MSRKIFGREDKLQLSRVGARRADCTEFTGEGGGGFLKENITSVRS